MTNFGLLISLVSIVHIDRSIVTTSVSMCKVSELVPSVDLNSDAQNNKAGTLIICPVSYGKFVQTNAIVSPF